MNAAERIRPLCDGTRTQVEIAKLAGISRQRVHQILAREGLLPLRAPHPNYATYCHRACLSIWSGQVVPLECDWCGVAFTRKKSGLRLEDPRYKGRHFCSRECYAASRRGQPRPGFSPPSTKVVAARTCPICHQVFEHSATVLRTTCSVKCKMAFMLSCRKTRKELVSAMYASDHHGASLRGSLRNFV